MVGRLRGADRPRSGLVLSRADDPTGTFAALQQACSQSLSVPPPRVIVLPHGYCSASEGAPVAQGDGEHEGSVALPALRVFLSYSRKDAVFTQRLAEALKRREYEPDFDQATYDLDNLASGIAAEDEWWQRLQQMIAAADTMIFVVSPDSAASKVCDEEIAWARGLGKRVIPILRGPIDFAKAPPRLSVLNVKLDFTADDDTRFNKAIDDLCRVLDRNVAWYRENTRLSALLARWQVVGRPDALLLSAADLDALGRLLEDRPRDAPEPSTALLELRDQSRVRINADRDRQRRIIGRAFVKPAEEALRDGLSEHALRLAAAGALLAEDVGLALVPELWPPMAGAITTNRTDRVLRGHTDTVNVTAFSTDGRRVLTGSDDDTASLWDAETGVETAVLKRGSGYLLRASFSPDGKRVLAGSSRLVKIFDVSRSESVARGRALVLTAALARGIGWRSDVEAGDLLMRDAPQDLFAEGIRQLGRPADDPALQDMIAALHAPLHDNRYLSPTQFVEKFGLAKPGHGASERTDEEAEPDDWTEEVGPREQLAPRTSPGASPWLVREAEPLTSQRRRCPIPTRLHPCGRRSRARPSPPRTSTARSSSRPTAVSPSSAWPMAATTSSPTSPSQRWTKREWRPRT